MKTKAAKILFLTSTNLASNPRCYKEITAALDIGYEVSVVAFDLPNWTRMVEKQIRSRLDKMEYESLQAGQDPFIPWLITSLTEKMVKALYKLGWRTLWMSAIVTDKRTIPFIRELKKKKPVCDLVIAHNPGAFYAAWWYSRKAGIPFAIDVEDFHPGENSDVLKKIAVGQLMRKILPAAAYVSFAAPLIESATLTMLGTPLNKSLVINNVFPVTEFPKPVIVDVMEDNKLKLVWFSQHISFKRGLEEVLPLLASFADRIQLTLIGNPDAKFVETVLSKYSFILIKEAMPQEDLNKALEDHDIGLAVESNKTDENRRICLTNKIWAYLQAGLFIWASNTPAQIQFSKKFPGHASIIDVENAGLLANLLENTLLKLPDLKQGKLSRWHINDSVSWDIEKRNLAVIWKATLVN